MFGRLNVPRLTQIARILAKYEFYHVLFELNLIKYLPLHQRFKSNHTPNINPVLIRKIFEELGGAFIKLGQLISLRPDLIGKEYSIELEKLLLDVPSMEYKKVVQKLKDLPITDISKKPLGSASISQVHKAKLKGKNVAIKIKRDGVDKIFREDILIMEFFAKQITKRFDISFINLNDIVSEFKRYTNNELNLQKEVKNIKRFRSNFKNSKTIKIPQVYEEYCTEDIIVMEYIDGKTILESGKKSTQAIKTISSAVYKMIFEDRFFHADLHPGNIYFKDNKIIFLDFGIVARITKEFEDKLFYLFASLVTADLEGTADALIELHIGDEEVQEEILKEGISDVLGDYYNVAVKDMNFAEVFYGAIEVARKSKIKLPSQLVLFGKSLITMEGFCRQADSNFNIVANAKPYVKKILQQRTSLDNMISQGKDFAKDFYFEASKFPKHMKSFSKKFTIIEKQMIGIDNNLKQFSSLFSSMIKLLSLTCLFGVFFVSSVLLIDFGILYKGYSIISLIGFTISFIILLEIIKYFLKKF